MEVDKPNKSKEPRRQWIDQVEEIARNKGKTLEDIKILARDRKAWKKWMEEDTPDAWKDIRMSQEE